MPESSVSDSADLGFLEGPVLEVAPRLLGAVLRHGDVAVRITEVEAYDGFNDPASHAFRGETPRSSVMFGPAGRLYVYFTYGMHHCCNVVCGEPGRASAVLLRAGRVVDGLDVVRSRRRGVRDDLLARGPALLCRALGIDLTHNLLDLAGEEVSLTPAAEHPRRIRTGPRVGVRHGAELHWRFWLTGDPTVSDYRAASVRGPAAGR